MSPWVIALAIFIVAGIVWLILVRTVGWPVVPGRRRSGTDGGPSAGGGTPGRGGDDAVRS